MSLLTRHATELTGVLHGIVHCLRASDLPLGRSYAQKLEPLATMLDAAVFESCDCDAAAQVMSEIDVVMNSLNGAATKGGFEFLATGSDLLNHYWELNTIFRETRYRGQLLTYDWNFDSRSRS